MIKSHQGFLPLMKMKTKNYCNKCSRLVEELNELEQEELDNEGSFVCSDCINKEMEDED